MMKRKRFEVQTCLDFQTQLRSPGHWLCSAVKIYFEKFALLKRQVA